MIVVYKHDKRHYHNRTLEYFHTDTVTGEVIQFVKKYKKAYLISIPKLGPLNREEFLQKYDKEGIN